MRPRRPNYYSILGVKREANQAQIKAAYRKLSREAHPDHAGRESEERQILLNEAYAVLSDEDKRRSYDLAALPITDVLREAAAAHTDAVIDAAAEVATDTLKRSIPKTWGKFGEALRQTADQILHAGADELRDRAMGRRS